MAYIVGILTEEQEAILVKRGWEIEAAPAELTPDDAELPTDSVAVSRRDRYKMVFIDRDMFDIMSGPDWDKRES